MKKFLVPILFVSLFVISCDKSDPEPQKSSAKSITSFKFSSLSPEVTGAISETGKTIALTVPAGTSVTALVPTIAFSDRATVSPASGAAQDFTNPVKYNVTAEDGSVQEYTVTVTIAVSTVKSSSKVISSFKFSALSPEIVGAIDEGPHFIKATVPNATNRTALTPTIVISEKATISPASGVAKDFTNPVVYTVTAEDGTFQEYLVTVSLDPTVNFTVSPVSTTEQSQDNVFFVTGTNFGDYTKNKVVLRNTATNVLTEIPAASASSATMLFARIPADQPIGSYKITIFIGLESKVLPETFTIGYHAPEITSLSATTVIRGNNITITGKYFTSTGNVVKLESTTLEIVSQSTTSIEVTVPETLAAGNYTLNITSNGKTTFYNTQDITVQIDPNQPVITSLDDFSYKQLETITITGLNLKKDGAFTNINFIPFHGGVTVVRTATPNDDGTQVTYTLPDDFPTGTYIIVVEVDFEFSDEYGEVIEITAN